MNLGQSRQDEESPIPVACEIASRLILCLECNFLLASASPARHPKNERLYGQGSGKGSVWVRASVRSTGIRALGFELDLHAWGNAYYPGCFEISLVRIAFSGLAGQVNQCEPIPAGSALSLIGKGVRKGVKYGASRHEHDPPVAC